MILEKRELHQSVITNWIRTKITEVLLKSTLLCLLGSRSISRNMCFVGVNIETAHEVAKI